MEEKTPTIERRHIVTSNNLVIIAADAALAAVQNTMGSIMEEDRYLYTKLARAALSSAREALGETN